MRTIFIATTCLLLACSSPQTTDSSKNVSEVPSSAQKAEDAEQEVSLAGWGTAEVEMLKVIGFRPQFVPESDLIIYTAKNLEGLWCHNPQGGQIRRLTEEKGAGIEPVVFRDRVVYQVKARKKYLEVVDLASGREQALEGNLRHMRPGEYAQRENKGTYVRVSDDLLSLELHSESGVQQLSPQGPKNYINASLSPNRNRLMYKVVGLGAFVSDLEGNTLSELGDVDAASWINQDEILYAISEDDGMETSSSRLVVQNLTNNDRILLKSSVEILENPSVNDKGNKIIANSPDGKMYLFTKQL